MLEVSRLRHFRSGSCPRITETGAFVLGNHAEKKQTKLKHDNSHKKKKKKTEARWNNECQLN